MIFRYLHFVYSNYKKTLIPERSGFSQLFVSGLNQPTVYIHSFVIDSEVVFPKVGLWKYFQIFQITKFCVFVFQSTNRVLHSFF